eukprot:GHRR01010410.1.p1 GENE.GHRR01010410.1~~GHRR01010410.1.p1  ORF type:complete len:1136 (+),score=513.58 GHRR01010410.1:867-4274(+)
MQVTQMKYRLSEGGSECFYYIGVEDDGYPRGLDATELAASIKIIQDMAASLQATARLVEYVRGGFGRTAALLHIKENAEEDMTATDLRIAVAGSMDSGKSTLVAVLTHGTDGRPLLDNGRGSARMAVFRHKHEIESGRTSSISQQVLGYDDDGRVVNYVGVAAPTPADIIASSSLLLNFIDMGGHEKYLKTTLYGMTCTLPDYVLLCIDAMSGVTRITREHLAVAVALEVPTVAIITKTDAVTAPQTQQVLQQLQQLLAPVLTAAAQRSLASAQKPCGQDLSSRIQVQATQLQAVPSANVQAEGTAASGSGSLPAHKGMPVITSDAQAVQVAVTLSELHSCTAEAASFQQTTYPVFMVSCMTGAGLSALHAFLSKLQPVSAHRSHRQSAGGWTAAEGALEAMSAADAQHQGGQPADANHQQKCCHQQQQQMLWSVAAPQQLGHMEGASKLWVPEQHSGASATAAVGTADGHSSQPAGHFQVVHTYDVEGVGWVVSGIAVTGSVEVGQALLWGPTAEGSFSPVCVTCIQRSHVPVRQVQPGQTATLALQPAGDAAANASKEALLSAAAAAQAAAEAQAAREAAAACAAAPTIPFGKPYVPNTGATVLHTAVATAEGMDGLLGPLLAAAATQLQTGAAFNSDPARPEVAAQKDSLDQLADDLVADLALDDNETAGASDYDSFDAFDDDATSYSASSVVDKGFIASCSTVGQGAEAAAWQQYAPSETGTVGSSSSKGRKHQCAQKDSQEWPQRVPIPRSATAPAVSNARAVSPASGTAATADGAAARSAGLESICRVASDSAVGQRAVHSDKQHGQRSSTALLGCSPSSWRSKGAVLLHSAAAPHTYWEFEALLVLLGGHWPARGLLSSCWPPVEHFTGEQESRAIIAEPAVEATAAASQTVKIQEQNTEGVQAAPRWAVPSNSGSAVGDSSLQQAGAQVAGSNAGRRRRLSKQRSKRCDYAYVVHCNSIRQIARVMFMKELRDGEQHSPRSAAVAGAAANQRSNLLRFDSSSSTSSSDIEPCSMPDAIAASSSNQCGGPKLLCCGLSASIQAAAALLQGPQWEGDSGGSSSSGGRARHVVDLGTVVQVRFRFTHRPEWLQIGARLIVRDRGDGHVAAAGFVTKLLDAHKQINDHNEQ